MSAFAALVKSTETVAKSAVDPKAAGQDALQTLFAVAAASGAANLATTSVKTARDFRGEILKKVG